MEKTVIYLCNGPFTVLMSSVLSKTVYSDYRNVVIIRENLFNQYNSNVDLFQKVYVKPEQIEPSEWLHTLEEILKKEMPEIIGVFTWGGQTMNTAAYNAFPDEAKIILIDEGTSSYNFVEQMRIHIGEIDFSKVKEVWLLDPQISLNKNVPEYKIPIERIVNDQTLFTDYITSINAFFNFRPFEFDSVLYFDNYLVQVGNISKNVYDLFIDGLMSVIGDLRITVKPHPSEKLIYVDERFSKYSIRKYSVNHLPWEIVVLNYIYIKHIKGCTISFPEILISTNSSALLTTQILLSYIDEDYPVVILNKLIHDWMTEKVNVTEKVLEKYFHTYSDRSMIFPDTWRELVFELSNHIKSVNENCIASIEKKENELLLEIKRNYVNYVNNDVRYKRLQPIAYLSDEFKPYFAYMKYKRIAIYGFGEVGKFLGNQLIRDGIEIAIAETKASKNAISIDELKNQIEEFDLVIVTPLLDCKMIIDELGNDKNVISYDDFIKEVTNFKSAVKV